MKPFPKAVQEAFPCAPNSVPERPWWYHAPIGWTRFIPALNTRTYGAFNAETAAEAAEADAKYPIPHPGFRAGQIWVDKDGWGIVITSSLNSTIWTAMGTRWSHKEFEGSYPYLVADPACPHLAPWSPAEE